VLGERADELRVVAHVDDDAGGARRPVSGGTVGHHDLAELPRDEQLSDTAADSPATAQDHDLHLISPLS